MSEPDLPVLRHEKENSDIVQLSGPSPVSGSGLKLHRPDHYSARNTFTYGSMMDYSWLRVRMEVLGSYFDR